MMRWRDIDGSQFGTRFACMRLMLAIGVALLCLASLADSAAAQSVVLQGNTSADSIGRIRGTAFDSLLMKPIARTRVQLMGTGRTTTTDDRGQFSFDKVTLGRHAVALESATFDSIGLGVLGASVTLRNEDIVRAAITTPSLRTLWNYRCRNSAPTGSDSAIVWGTIRDAADDSLLTGAAAQFSWYNLRPGGIALGMLIDEKRVEATSDNSGTYFACGLPHDIVVSSEAIGKDAAGKGTASGHLEYAIGPRRVFRADLTVSADMVIPDSLVLTTHEDSVRADRARGTASVYGRVVDDKGKPLSNAIVVIANVDTSVRTNSNGEFRMSGLPSGTHTLLARRVGDSPSQQFVNLRPMQTTSATIVMSKVTTLATVNVRAQNVKGRDRIDYEWRRKMGFGYAMDADEIARRMDVYSVLTQMPGMRLERSGFGVKIAMQQIGFRGYSCEPSVYLDGIMMPMETATSMPAESYRAIEVYPRASTVPAEYYNGGGCGTVLMWTRRAAW